MDIRAPRNGTDRRALYEGGSQGSPLYSAPRRNFNPSAAGGHIQEEVAEMTKWVNQHLSRGEYSNQLVTDLAEDMADGITLLRLVQVMAMANEPLPKHFSNPMMRVQKLENLQMCMQLLKRKGVMLTGVHAEDIVGGNLKSVLAVCHAVRRHFAGGPSPKNGLSVSPRGGQRSSRLSFSSLDRDDMALLSWLGNVVHKDIQDYTALYDGRILCELMNEVHVGAVSEEDIATKNSEELLKLAFAAGEQYLYITKGSVNIRNIASGLEDARLKSYLHQSKLIYQQMERRWQLKKMQQEQQSTSASRERKRRSHPRSPSREEAFESLRMSSTTGSLESREAAKVASRSYEGLRQKKISSEGQERPDQAMPSRNLSTPVGSTETLLVAPPPPQRSNSTSQIPSHPHLPPPHPHSSKRPLSEIYVSGASSFTELSTIRSDHAGLIKPRLVPKHSGSQNKEDHFQGSQLGRTQYGLHRSMDSGMASATSQKVPTPTSLGSSWNSASSGDHSTGVRSGYESDSATSSLSKSTGFDVLGQGTSLPRSYSHSGLPSPSPTLPPSTTTLFNKSRTYSTESFNQPTFDLPGGRMVPRRSTSYSRLDSTTADEISVQVADLQERVGVLSLQMLFEKADLYRQLRRTLARERKRRQAVEKKLTHLEQTAQQMVQHYDSCFIDLAKQVSSLRAELRQTKTSGGQPTPKAITMEIEAIKQQLSTLTKKEDSTSPLQQASHQPANPPKGATKRSLFLRKRSNTIDSPATSTSQGPFLRGSISSFRKLSNFFGEEPPRVEDLESFLERLGYSYLTQKFTTNQITLAELRHMEDAHLERLGIPLGPRVRILSELKLMQPLDNVSDVI